MGPKPKKGGKEKPKTKKDGKKKNEENTNAVDEEEKKRRELVKEAKNLFDLTKKEEQAFNEFQQQREKLNYFWIVEKKKLEDKKAELRNKEREAQDLDEKYQVEIKSYKQRVKHLLYEHQNEVTHLKTEGEKSIKITQDEYKNSEKELKGDRRNIKLSLKEMELSHEDYLKTLKQDHDKKMTLQRQEFERKAKELQQRYERKKKSTRDELESRRRDETQKIEERKSAHIAQLMSSHEKAFGEIKNYYNDITHNNLDLIKSLKEDVAEMKKKEAQDEKLMFEISQENKRMSEPLKRALKDVDELRTDLSSYDKDKQELQTVKNKLFTIEDNHSKFSWEHEVLLQRFEQVKKERDELRQQFQKTVYDVQQKTGFKNMLLEKKLESMHEVLEQKDTQLNEVLAHAQIDPSVLGQVRGRLEDLIEAKNQTIRDLEMEMEKIEKAHRDMIQKFEMKLSEYGVPFDELGFNPNVPHYKKANGIARG